MSQLHVINHPMIQHKLTILRAGLGDAGDRIFGTK